MGGRGSGQHDNHRSKYQVAEVRDGEGVPVYVTMQRAGESFIELAWSCRHLVDNPLMRWLRTLDCPPKAPVLLGSGAPLTHRAAWLLIRFRREEVAKMAGSWPNEPDFALWPAMNRGGRNRRHPVCRVRGEVVEHFTSIEAAARAVGTARDDIDGRLTSGHPDAAGWSWWDAEPQGVYTSNRA